MILLIVLMIIVSGLTAYVITKYMLQIKKYGPVILLTAKYSNNEHGQFIQLKWNTRIPASNPKEEFIVQRKAGLQIFPSEIAITAETELRDYDISSGKTYTYMVYGGRDSTIGYDARISNQVKVTT